MFKERNERRGSRPPCVWVWLPRSPSKPFALLQVMSRWDLRSRGQPPSGITHSFSLTSCCWLSGGKFGRKSRALIHLNQTGFIVALYPSPCIQVLSVLHRDIPQSCSTVPDSTLPNPCRLCSRLHLWPSTCCSHWPEYSPSILWKLPSG